MTSNGHPGTKPATIYDVARLAKVSTATVSMAINGKGRIRGETRQRVMAVCEQLHYKPHPTARFMPRLRGETRERPQTGVLAFTPVSPSRAPSGYPEFLTGVSEAATTLNKIVAFQPMLTDEIATRPPLARFGIDGRLLIGDIDDTVVQQFKGEDAPLVVMGDHRCLQSVWNVNLDYQAAGRMAFDHLWSLGHRRVAALTQASPSFYQDQVIQGFREGAVGVGLDPRALPIIPGQSSDEEDRLLRLLRQPERPTALFCILLGRAMHAFTLAGAAGLSCPDDLSILLFGRQDLSIHRAVTQVDPRHEEVGRRAMKIVMGLVENNDGGPTRTLVPPVMVDGGSCTSSREGI